MLVLVFGCSQNISISAEISKRPLRVLLVFCQSLSGLKRPAGKRCGLYRELKPLVTGVFPLVQVSS
jgi:hypothetical protein